MAKESKPQKLFTALIGANKKAFVAGDIGGPNGHGDDANAQRVYPWWDPGEWNFYVNGGKAGTDQKMPGGHEYYITDRHGSEDNARIGFDHKWDIFSVNSSDRSNLQANGGKSGRRQVKGGYNFSFNNHINKSHKGYSNGFAYYATTKEQKPLGGSPMPVVGIIFNVWADGNGIWADDANKNGVWGNKSSTRLGEAGQVESVDHQINKIHLVYHDLETGNVFSKLILPEGNNSGDFQFCNRSYSKGEDPIHRYIEKENACSFAKSIKVRAWHTDELPPKSVFVGFTVHVFVGIQSDVNKVKSFFIGGMIPILKGDLEIMRSANSNSFSGACNIWQPRIDSQADAEDRFDPNTGQKLLIHDDLKQNNYADSLFTDNYRKSIEKYSADFKYPD